ncbi:hypothetical protein GW17_00032572 [Ensete ventricosum]|nr:hypothetical protein GW17_00032572 [Ensete ventricosum]
MSSCITGNGTVLVTNRPRDLETLQPSWRRISCRTGNGTELVTAGTGSDNYWPKTEATKPLQTHDPRGRRIYKKPAAAGSSHRLLEIQMAQRRLPFFFLLIVALAVFSTLLGGAPVRADLVLLMVKCRDFPLRVGHVDRPVVRGSEDVMTKYNATLLWLHGFICFAKNMASHVCGFPCYTATLQIWTKTMLAAELLQPVLSPSWACAILVVCLVEINSGFSKLVGNIGAGAYIVGVVDHPYLAIWLPLWLTMPSYTSTTPASLRPRNHVILYASSTKDAGDIKDQGMVNP